jgi:hypothetical protein
MQLGSDRLVLGYLRINQTKFCSIKFNLELQNKKSATEQNQPDQISLC